MNWSNLLETVMLLCFGAAWPLSIAKSWRARTAKGKSIGFLLVILTGYVAGIIRVTIEKGLMNFLIIPYTVNFLMVACDTCLWFRNRRLDRLSNL
ncbi:MAG: hypothetical protein K6E38_08770 [Fretibacterium sp.]|nr:hypothetical protein [Fretibacterium sp.]